MSQVLLLHSVRLTKIIDNNNELILFLGVIKLTGRHHLNQLVLFIIGWLLLDHLLFTWVGLYIARVTHKRS
jgi:hypothetical protein